MTITPELISPLLRDFGISGAITGVGFYRNRTAQGCAKIVARVDVKHRPPLVIRLVRDPHVTHEQNERRSAFSEHLRRNGIHTPERYGYGASYCLERVVDGIKVDVTLEDWCGESLSEIDALTAAEAGRLMGRIHRNSFRDNLKIGVPTEFNAVGANSYAAVEKLRQLADTAKASRFKAIGARKLCSNPELFDEILDLFDQKIANAKTIWDRLPCSAVQGDITAENLSYVDGRLYVFDYSSAGDETLVGDMVLEGMKLAFESRLAGGLCDADREGIFRAFLLGYRGICPLTHDERLAACDLYPAYNALWFSRVAACDGKYPDSLEAAMDAGNLEKADTILDTMYQLITADARRIFASELFEGK